MAIPNLDQSTAVLVGERLFEASRVEKSSLPGWLVLFVAPFDRVSVRESSINAVRFKELPAEEPFPELY